MSNRSEAFRRSIEFLKALDSLMRRDVGGSAEAAELRRRMDEPWYEMSDEECSLVDQLSADLYTLWEPPRRGPSPSSQSTARFRLLWDGQQWKEALALLNELPGLLSPLEATLVRGRAWLALGESGVAEEFFELAIRLAVPLPVADRAPQSTRQRAGPMRFPAFAGAEVRR